MTSMPASRRVRAMILAPRSWPSSPGLATTTRMGPLIADASVSGSPLRRREHHEQREPLLDRVEPVLDVSRDEEHVARRHLPVLAGARESGPAGDDVVGLVLPVRALRVGRARLEYVEARAHRVGAEELAVKLAGRRTGDVDLVQGPGVHRRDPSDVTGNVCRSRSLLE